MKIRNVMIRLIFAVLLFMGSVSGFARRWEINPEGNITWQIGGESHRDHIEMAGKRVAVVLRYGVDDRGCFRLEKSVVWPMLRTLPNDTHASLMRRFGWNPLDGVVINGRPLGADDEKVVSVTLDGTMVVRSGLTAARGGSLALERVYFPSAELPSLVETYRFTNTGGRNVVIEIPASDAVINTAAEKGADGSYRIEQCVRGTGCYELKPGESAFFSASLSAYKDHEPSCAVDAVRERQMRRELVEQWRGNLMLETPDPVIDRMFAFSKIRACESIYETKEGPMHGPGGESYYAAVWANDQAEYINPYFPFVGYDYGNASAMNAFRLFARYMNEEWKPIPSSIIAEGDGFWNGAGDRGDAAMIAYGAARYALARGDREEAIRLWPLLEWCLEYCRRKINGGGVVASDADELEHRFPAGEANLCTSSLYYDALLSAAYLAEGLGKKPSVARSYRTQASRLEKSVDDYFASQVEGFDTYAYYKGNDVLRSWICIPLTVGISRRAAGTVEALFSPRLWSGNGLLTQAGSTTFWDRSTLYALRGVFMAGETGKALAYLKHYSATRLLGEHVPYAVEAWPEGGQRHLSAESALYGRIFTEGLFGIRPTGFRSFTLSPRLPEEWGHMALRKIRAFGSDFDIRVEREVPGMLRVTVGSGGRVLLDRKIREGKSLECRL